MRVPLQRARFSANGLCVAPPTQAGGSCSVSPALDVCAARLLTPLPPSPHPPISAPVLLSDTSRFCSPSRSEGFYVIDDLDEQAEVLETAGRCYLAAQCKGREMVGERRIGARWLERVHAALIRTTLTPPRILSAASPSPTPPRPLLCCAEDGVTPTVVAPRVEMTLEWLVESPPPEHTWEEPPIFYDGATHPISRRVPLLTPPAQPCPCPTLTPPAQEHRCTPSALGHSRRSLLTWSALAPPSRALQSSQTATTTERCPSPARCWVRCISAPHLV